MTTEPEALPALTEEQKARCAALARTFPEVGDAIEAAMEVGIAIARSTLTALAWMRCDRDGVLLYNTDLIAFNEPTQEQIDRVQQTFRETFVPLYDHPAPETQSVELQGLASAWPQIVVPELPRGIAGDEGGNEYWTAHQMLDYAEASILADRRAHARGESTPQTPAPASEAPVVLPEFHAAMIDYDFTWSEQEDICEYATHAVLADRQSRATQPAPSTREALTAQELDLCRQWYDAASDLNSAYLTQEDALLAVKLYAFASIRPSYRLLEAAGLRTAAAALDTEAGS